MSLHSFIRKSRAQFTCPNTLEQLRIVCVSEILRKDSINNNLADFIADKAPLYYRTYDKFVESLKDGFFLSSIKETLNKLPTSEHFQSSHFGEITAAIFVEDIIGLKKIYSKLSLNTTENQNAYKMDLVCYVPGSNPINFVFCEVKSSPKNAIDGLPAEHDKSCFPDIFNSLRKYTDEDMKFDLTCIKDNLPSIDDLSEREMIRKSLTPYKNKLIGYIGIAVIDNSTYDSNEVNILGTRRSTKKFDVELLCIESYRDVSLDTYKILEKYKK